MCVALENIHTSPVGNKGMLFLCPVTSILNTLLTFPHSEILILFFPVYTSTFETR